MSVSGSDDDGVIGYQATTVTPANMQPIAAAALPSTRIWPAVLFIRATRYGSRFVQMLGGVLLARLERAHVERHRLRLLAELLGERLLHLAQLDRQQLARGCRRRSCS